jgi:hypothetical protein
MHISQILLYTSVPSSGNPLVYWEEVRLTDNHMWLFYLVHCFQRCEFSSLVGHHQQFRKKWSKTEWKIYQHIICGKCKY